MLTPNLFQRWLPGTLVFLSLVQCLNAAADKSTLRQELAHSRFELVHESYVNDNWDLFVMNADGSNARNLTHTPKINELYPQVAPDGTRIAFVVDTGEGRDTVRSVWVMDVDGRHRKKIADYARQPFWSPDSKVVGYLPQEYPKFNVIDYFTKGMMFHELATGKSWPHPNSANLHHLYNPGFSPNGKWIVATVHAGMGFDHAIVLIEARGDKIINLGIPGCRPTISPDGTMIAWGPEDHEIATAPIDTSSDDPKVGKKWVRVHDAANKIYHVDWSPDNRFISISRGPDGEGDLSKPNTYTAACEIVGVYAKHWDIFAVSAEHPGIVDLHNTGMYGAVQLTTDGNSNKESDWFRPTQTQRP